MSEVVVQATNLRKEFGPKVAVDNVSFSIKAGEILGFLGPNGAGKTTVIQMLLGLIKRTSGEIKIFGLDPEHHRVEILQRCNFSSAYVNLPYNLTVLENLQIFAGLYEVKNAKGKISNLLEMFEISHLKNARTGGLSSGESTRVHLCKAMLNDPELLLLDEPTASLDPDIADKVRKILKNLQPQRNISIIYTSHNMKDVQELCQRILFVHHGKILVQGTPNEVMEKFEHDSLEEVFIHIARNGELIEENQNIDLNKGISV